MLSNYEVRDFSFSQRYETLDDYNGSFFPLFLFLT
jgi:hypothetical protein